MVRVAAMIGLVATIGFVAGCDEPTSPLRQVTIDVDSAVYHLQPHASGGTIWWYHIDLTTTISNASDREVYLYQRCGHWHLGRADGDTTPLILGQYGCIEQEPVEPELIPPGGKYVRSFRIHGSNSPDTRPRITLSNNVGTLAFSYWISDARDERKSKRVTSAPFRVDPPVQSDQ